MIEIYEIPYTTATEIIMDKVAELIKAGKIREIADMRDETDLNGLKLTIDLKRGVEPEKLMQKLFKTTTLQDSFGCNFNILVGGMPRVMGVREIFEEWTAWRCECVKRRVYHQLQKKKDKLHLLHYGYEDHPARRQGPLEAHRGRRLPAGHLSGRPAGADAGKERAFRALV